METLTLIPIEDSVVFPGMTATLALDVGDEERVFLVPRRGDQFAAVGTVARVAERLRIPGGAQAVTLEGLHRGVAGPAAAGTDGALRVEVTSHEDDSGTERAGELAREYRAVVEEILELRAGGGEICEARTGDPGIGPLRPSLAAPGALADTAGYSPDLSFDQKR